MERFAGMDAEGKAVFTKYAGKRNVVTATISRVELAGNNPSVSLENSKVTFELLPGETVHAHPGCRQIELHFDEHGILESKLFAKGDQWTIILAD